MNAGNFCILIVDDDPVVLEVMKDNLEAAGYPVYIAENWTTMSEILQQNSIAVVLLDVNMPEIGGDKLAPMIMDLVDPHPSVVLHSSMAEVQLRRLSRKVGAQSFLPKGSEERMVLRVVEAAAAAFDLRTGARA